MNLYFPAQSSAHAPAHSSVNPPDCPPSGSPANECADPSGHWLLQTGRAVTVLSRGGGQLSIARGQIWATLGSAAPCRYLPWHRAPLQPCATLKDYFLSAGDTLRVPPGARVVIESLLRTHDLPVAFNWSYTAPLARARRYGLKSPATRASHAELAQATGELGAALSQVARALRRLVGAVLASRSQARRSPKQAPELNACLRARTRAIETGAACARICSAEKGFYHL